MADKQGTVTMKRWDGENVEVIGPDYAEGQPAEITRWEDKLRDRKQRLAYILSADRYFYASEGFGSEKRKNPA